jgi:hypothetical protein
VCGISAPLGNSEWGGLVPGTGTRGGCNTTLPDRATAQADVMDGFGWDKMILHFSWSIIVLLVKNKDIILLVNTDGHVDYHGVHQAAETSNHTSGTHTQTHLHIIYIYIIHISYIISYLLDVLYCITLLYYIILLLELRRHRKGVSFLLP